MQVPTHILSGWVVANAFPLRPRERLLAMVAATIPDLDGVSRVFGERAFQDWHHKACHNLPFCVLTSSVFVMISRRRPRGRAGLFVLYAGLFHLHLLMDYWGSGPGWPIVYFWPFSAFYFVNWRAWELTSWQNTLTAAVMLAITIGIAVVRKRTPLERLMPSLDAKLTGRAVPAAQSP